MSNTKRALFLDADGTIIKTKSGQQFPEGIHDWCFRDEVIVQLKVLLANEAYDYIFIVTNQGGIEAGFNKHEHMRTKFDLIQEALLKEHGIKVNEVYMCPYNSYHYTRKPEPGFAYRAAIKYQLSLKDSLMIGYASGLEGNFSDSDAMFASNAGIPYIDVEYFLLIPNLDADSEPSSSEQ